MKKTIKGNLNTRARATKNFIKEIREKYNTITDKFETDIYAVDCELGENKTIEFYVDENVYEEVLAELQAREEIEITSFETAEHKEEKTEEIKETESTTSTNLIAKGFKVWAKEDKKRIYINDIKKIVSTSTLATEYNIMNPKSFLREIDGLYYDMNTNTFEFRCSQKYRKDLEEIVEAIEKEINK